MMFRSFVAASALSLSASAFLVVPEVHHPVEGHGDLPASHALEIANARSETFQLLCDSCPFPETSTDGVVSWSEDTKSSLELNFRIENGNLFMNDAHVFPVDVDSIEMVKAVQRRESDGQETEPLKLGFALTALPAAPRQNDMELFEIRFSPLDIDGHPAPLDTVSISAIVTTLGELFILRIETELPAGEDDHDSWKNCNGEMQCLRRLIFDRIRALVHSAQAHMMNLTSKLGFKKGGCHGKSHGTHRKPGHRRPEISDFEEGKPEGDHSQHSHPHHHHRHHHHHHKHGLRRTVLRIIRFVLVPALLGICAGLTASAMGMLVGQVIVFLWMRYRRNTTSRSTSTLEQGTVSEKAVLMAEDLSNEELPPYTDEENAEKAPLDTK